MTTRSGCSSVATRRHCPGTPRRRVLKKAVNLCPRRQVRANLARDVVLDQRTSLEDSILVICQPPLGQEARILLNEILDAPGAVVTTSTRLDNLTTPCSHLSDCGVRPAAARRGHRTRGPSVGTSRLLRGRDTPSMRCCTLPPSTTAASRAVPLDPRPAAAKTPSRSWTPTPAPLQQGLTCSGSPSSPTREPAAPPGKASPSRSPRVSVWPPTPTNLSRPQRQPAPPRQPGLFEGSNIVELDPTDPPRIDAADAVPFDRLRDTRATRRL